MSQSINVSTVSPAVLRAGDQILMGNDVYTVFNSTLDPEDEDKQRWNVIAINNCTNEYVVKLNVHETSGFRRLFV